MARRPRHIGSRAFLLGILTGGRAATPLAVLGLHQGDRALRGSWQQWRLFASPIGRGLLLAAAVGELIGDKLPRTPSRIAPGGLIGRAASGALVGAAIGTTGRASRGSDPRLDGAVLGAVGALVGSFVGYLLRTRLSRHAPATLVALGEDAAVVGGAVKVLSTR